jgi:hypothetical protein
MYWHINFSFMPISETGRASVKNSHSSSTASRMIFSTVSG